MQNSGTHGAVGKSAKMQCCLLRSRASPRLVRTHAQEDDDDYIDYKFLGAEFKNIFKKKRFSASKRQLYYFHHFIEYFQYLQNGWCNVVIGNVELS